MTQFNTPMPRRAGGEIDVYTGLLCAAFLILAAGVFLVATANAKHSETRQNANDGSFFKLVGK